MTLAIGGQTASSTSQKEVLLAQSGFKVKTITTSKQQQHVSGLAQGRVSVVKYNGKVYYIYPTAKKDQVYVGNQAQFNAHKQALKARQVAQQGQQQMAELPTSSRKQRDRITPGRGIRQLWPDGRGVPGKLVRNQARTVAVLQLKHHEARY